MQWWFSPIKFLTSGAGSKAWRVDTKEMNKKGLNFFYDGQGFKSVRLTQTEENFKGQFSFFNIIRLSKPRGKCSHN